MSDIKFDLIAYLISEDDGLKIDKIIHALSCEEYSESDILLGLKELEKMNYIFKNGNEYYLKTIVKHIMALNKIIKDKDIIAAKDYFASQNTVDRQYQNRHHQYHKKAEDIHEDYFKNIRRHEYLIANNDIDAADLDEYLAYFQNDIDNFAHELEKLIEKMLAEFENFDELVSAKLRLTYLNEIKLIFKTIYNTQYKNLEYQLDLNYRATVATYELESRYKQQKTNAKFINDLELQLQALILAVDVADIQNEIEYQRATKLFLDNSNIENKLAASKIFANLAAYKDANRLSLKAKKQYDAYFACTKIREEITELEKQNIAIKNKLDKHNENLKYKKEKYLKLNDKYEDLKLNIENNRDVLSQKFEKDLEQINQKIKDVMGRYNELIDRRNGLNEELANLAIFKFNRKKELEMNFEDVCDMLDDNLDKKTSLERERSALLNQKEERLNQPERDLENLSIEIKKLKQDIDKAEYESHRLTQNFLNLQNSLNIKKSEYAKYAE